MSLIWNYTNYMSWQSARCLRWNTERPFIDLPRESPMFTFMNSQWTLIFRCDLYRLRTSYIYTVAMHCRGDLSEFHPFLATVHLESPSSESGPLVVRKYGIDTLERAQTIYQITKENIHRAITDWDIKGKVVVVIFFEKLEEYPFFATMTEEKSVQASFYHPSMAVGELDAETPPLNSPPASVNKPYNLESLSNDFSHMLDENILHDVLLKVGDEEICAHRTVLAARSKVFAAMFQHKMSESSSGVINIKDMDSPVLHLFLKYLYSGKISEDGLTNEIAHKLYVASDKYEVDALKKTCASYMLGNINECNYLAYLKLAIAHVDEGLKNAVVCFIIKDDSLLKSPDWLDFAALNPHLANEIYLKYVQK